MIRRIVKMTFRKEAAMDFEAIFENSCELIRGFEGCESLELTKGANDQPVYFTISTWQSVDHLNAYRNSDLFKTTWSATKALFDGKPEAWSTETVKFLD